MAGFWGPPGQLSFWVTAVDSVDRIPTSGFSCVLRHFLGVNRRAIGHKIPEVETLFLLERFPPEPQLRASPLKSVFFQEGKTDSLKNRHFWWGRRGGGKSLSKTHFVAQNSMLERDFLPRHPLGSRDLWPSGPPLETCLTATFGRLPASQTCF